MKQVLVVGDELSVLDGLHRMIRSIGSEWETAFIRGRETALAVLQVERFDAIVVDMCVLGTNGTRLLSAVRERHPHMTRIMISEQSEPETVRVTSLAHQFLAKPCDATQLKGAMERAFAIHTILANEDTRQVIAALPTLPRPAEPYMEVMKEIQGEGASPETVGMLIGRDIDMSSELLGLVNYAFFRLPHRVSDPIEAVTLLGVEVISVLLPSVCIFSEYKGVPLAGLRREAIQLHGIMTGDLARRISEAEGCDAQACRDAHWAGVLHDVGKLILAANMPSRYQMSMSLARSENIAAGEAEQAVLGTTHAEIGAYLAGMWELPYPVMDAVRFHHLPAESSSTVFSPTVAVHVADALQKEYRVELLGETPIHLDRRFLASIGMADRLPLWESLQVGGIQEEKVG